MLTYASSAAEKWSSLRTCFWTGSLRDVRHRIPEFERRQTTNQHLDLVIRRRSHDVQQFVPVGTVSRRYGLLQHRAVFDAVAEALDAVGIASDAVATELCLTEYGERMALSVVLPECFTFDPGDSYPIALRFECLNSVDRSTRFRALLGWYRLVCANGMIVGTTHYDMTRRHAGEMDLNGLQEILRRGLETAETERRTLQAWRGVKVEPDAIAQWVDGAVRETWGFKAAARAWHIMRTGTDAVVKGSYKSATPTTIALTPARTVRGAPSRTDNLFDISQALAWLARQRRDLEEQLAWREQIPSLIGSLQPPSVDSQTRHERAGGEEGPTWSHNTGQPYRR